jgi:hypothetical protein
VLLHAGGWSQELRSNRWHYAKAFARHAPVVIAQAGGVERGPHRTDSRIPNVTVLEIGRIRPFLDDPREAASVIRRFVADRGFARPLVWLSAPLAWNVAVELAPWPVVYHATEDLATAHYTDHFSRSYLLDCMLASANDATAVVACSAGVAASLVAHTGRSDIIVSSNGVSMEDYGPDAVEEAVDLDGETLAKAMVFAGNINKRLDFDIIDRLADEIDDRCILLVGPVSLPADLSARFSRLTARANVVHLGTKSTAELAFLYRRSCLGIVPYTRDDVIERAGFPLKTLEMVASGLTVVSSHMDATHNLDERVICAHSPDEFVSACRTHSRTPGSKRTAAEDGGIPPVITRFSYERLIPDTIDQVALATSAPLERSMRRVRPRAIRIAVDALSSIGSRGVRSFIDDIRRVLLASR